MDLYLFFLLLLLSSGSFIYEICIRMRNVRLGRPENRSDRPYQRWRYLLNQVLGQREVVKYPFFGWCHAFIMYGFVMLLPDIPNMAAEGLFHANIPYIGNNIPYLFLEDLVILLVIIGVIGCIARRTLRKPDWLHNSPKGFAILQLILVIVITEVLYHGSRFALGEGLNLMPAAPLTSVLSRLFAGMKVVLLVRLSAVFWWTHFLAIFSLLFIIPRSKHLHLVFAPVNAYWHSISPKGSLNSILLEGQPGRAYGAGRIEDFTWKQLFDTYACASCGRCNDRCPAFRSGEPLKPKKLQGRLRKHIDERAPLLVRQRAGNADTSTAEQAGVVLDNRIAGSLYKPDYIWSCTTCRGCEEACPVSCEHISKLVDMRRYLIMAEGTIPEGATKTFANIARQGNPWGADARARCNWVLKLGIPTLAEHPDAEYLYFIGCAGSFDEIARRATIDFISILKMAQVDFAILADEWCCGETVRRMGNEALFQEIAARNVSAWHDYRVKKVLTTCPHCFNTLKNEYPQFGGRYELIHHSALLAGMIRKGDLKPDQRVEKSVAYHDPCYLGRYQDIYQEPRSVLQAVPGLQLKEMPRSGALSFCCGAGGGRFWTKPRSENLISGQRVQEALATGAEIICTACPYCRMNISEELKLRGFQDRIKVMDIVEMLNLSIAGSNQP